MSENRSFFGKLFDPSGNSGRLEFFLMWLVSIVLAFILIGIYTIIVSYIRRWHDLGKSGWNTLVFLIPLVNWIVLFYLFFTPGLPKAEQ